MSALKQWVEGDKLPDTATAEECWKHLKQYPDKLVNIPKSRRTEEMFLYVASTKHMEIIFYPRFESELNEQIYTAIVIKNPRSFSLVPSEHVTQLMCDIVCGTKFWAEMFQCIPDKFKTEELCGRVYRANHKSVTEIPKTHITKTMYMKAITNGDMTIKDIPIDALDEDLCVAALKAGAGLKQVPPNLRTQMVCVTAIVKDENAFNYIPNVCKTPAVCKVAVTKDPKTIRAIPIQTPELCKIAVGKDPSTLRYLDPEAQTEEICMLAFATIYAPPLTYAHNQTREICLHAVGYRAEQLKYVKHQTDEICRVALTRTGGCLQYVREQTKELCVIAINQDPNAIQHVNEKTPDLYLLALSRGCHPAHVNTWTPELIDMYLHANNTRVNHLAYLPQTPQLCLRVYRLYDTAFENIESVEHQQYVVCCIVAEKLSALRALDLSASLGCEIAAVLDGADLFPRWDSDRARLTGRDGNLSPGRRWKIVAFVKHWTP